MNDIAQHQTHFNNPNNWLDNIPPKQGTYFNVFHVCLCQIVSLNVFVHISTFFFHHVLTVFQHDILYLNIISTVFQRLFQRLFQHLLHSVFQHYFNTISTLFQQYLSQHFIFQCI